jgi:branched-chain amino acid transport system permease protein
MYADRTSTVNPFKGLWPLISLIVIVLAVGVVSNLIDDLELDQTLIEMLINLVVVVGMYIFIGNSGITSFGHIGFMAIGAYAGAWQTCCPNLKPITMPGLPDFILHTTVPVIPAILLGGLLAAAVALVVGVFIMRLSGIGASIGTFAFLAIVNVVYSNWTRVTGGTSSIVGIPVDVHVWTAIAWVIITLVGAFLYQSSKFGVSLRASRDNEVAAQAAGVDIFRERLLSFVISAFFVGVGGSLYGHFLGVLTTNVFYLSLTFITLAMLVIGGIGSLAGAVIGVIAISVLIEVLRQLEQGVQIGGASIGLPSGAEEILLGVAMLLILIYRPRGLTNSREIIWPFKNGDTAPQRLKKDSPSAESAL